MAKNLGIAFGMMLTASLALFGILWTTTGDSHVAEGVAGLPFIAAHHVFETLERQ